MIALGLWDASFAALWILALIQTVVLISLVRQVGVLLLRVGQVFAPRSGSGPSSGDRLTIPEINSPEAAGPWGRYGGEQKSGERRRVLLFTSPDCGLCRDLVPSANAVAQKYASEFEIIIVADGEFDEMLEWAEETRAKIPVVAVPDVVKKHDIPGTPFAAIVDDRNIVLASGWVNYLEHLESLMRSCPKDATTARSVDHASEESGRDIERAGFVGSKGGD